MRPIDEKYLSELSKLQDTYTKAARLEDAVLIANEIKRIKARLGMPDTPNTPTLVAPPASPAVASASGKDMTITIPANSPNGYRLGGIQRGDTITLQYVGGKWKDHGGIATENPDDAKAEGNSRLVIAEAPDVSGLPGRVIKEVPTDTISKPFTYVMQTTRSDVVLRILSNSQRKENPGSVIYKMKLVR
ncbi:MAG: hypothetical protein R3F13_20095 [Prosthecobacter sp.]